MPAVLSWVITLPPFLFYFHKLFAFFPFFFMSQQIDFHCCNPFSLQFSNRSCSLLFFSWSFFLGMTLYYLIIFVPFSSDLKISDLDSLRSFSWGFYLSAVLLCRFRLFFAIFHLSHSLAVTVWFASFQFQPAVLVWLILWCDGCS